MGKLTRKEEKRCGEKQNLNNEEECRSTNYTNFEVVTLDMECPNSKIVVRRKSSACTFINDELNCPITKKSHTK